MIYTLTLNPAIDYVIGVENFTEGIVNRTSYEKIIPGGKGINVSYVLNNLGVENTALGIISGFSGVLIKTMLDDFGIKSDFVVSENGFSRINVKIKAKTETEINANGPSFSEQDIKNLYKKLNEIKEGDFIVLAGSVPKSLSKTIYSDILEYLKEKKLNIILDTTKESLKDALKYHPFLIKPNNYELGELFNTVIDNDTEAEFFAKKLQDEGAENVLVSLGKDGAILVLKNGEVLKQKAPEGKVINTTGAGDSLVAGFLAGFIKKRDFSYALKLGIASGSASAFSENLASGDKIRGIFEIL